MGVERCLVTGANGFVGSALCAQLLARGFAVRTIVRSPQARNAGTENTLVATLDANTDCTSVLAGVKVVFHLASRVHVVWEATPDAAIRYRQTNVEATLNLAHQAAQAGVSRFIFVSTVKVHGEATAPGQPWTEASALCPRDLYAQSKLEAEVGLQALAAQTGMELVIVRPPLVYGPGVRANFAALMRVVGWGVPVPLGAIHNKRSLLALGNLVDFLIVCANAPQAAGQAFFVSDGRDLSTPELVLEMARAAGVKPRLFGVPMWLLKLFGRVTGQQAVVERLSDNLQVDISKARVLLGWRPKLSVAEGMDHAAPSLRRERLM